MPKYWMINDRDMNGVGIAPNKDGLTYWVSDTGPLNQIENWTKVPPARFRTLVATAADNFPALPAANNDQKHVTILVAGQDASFNQSTSFYENFRNRLFEEPDGLGLCILYDWPTSGNILGYEADRARARAQDCSEDLANILLELCDWLLDRRQAHIDSRGNPDVACKAKLSLVAHSMGNYLLQKAMATAWTRKKQPPMVGVIKQLLMVAADVDNDLFDAHAPDNYDGSAIVNLSYRITALYSGRDSVLSASASSVDFSRRRLGRTGLAYRPPLVDVPPQTDNVWDVNCSSFFPASVDGEAIHGAYFETEGVLELIRQILRGIDRSVLWTLGVTQGNTWP